MSVLTGIVRRLVTAIAGLALVAAGVGVGLATAGAHATLHVGERVFGVAPTLSDLGWSAAIVLLVLVGRLLIPAAFWPARRTLRSIPLRLPQSPVGGLEVTMTPTALLSLIRYEAFRVPGVAELDGRIDVSETGWNVSCDVSSSRDTPVRPLADALDQRLRDCLLLHTGVPLANLSVDVRPIAQRPSTLR